MVCVTHDDASAYARWLSAQTGKKYRLPSEAEWEYAARAGNPKDHYFGDKPTEFCEFANLIDQSAAAEFKKRFGFDTGGLPCDDGAAFTQVVGMYAPNAFGLHDMLGNASEWVADCQHPNYEGAPADGSAWTQACDTTDGPMFITRGGAYASGPSVSERGHGERTNASSLGEGFRLALDGQPAAGPGQARLGKAIEQAQAQARSAAAAKH